MTKDLSITDLGSILALAGAILSLSLIAYLRIHIGQLIYVITGILSFLACVAYLVLKWRQKLSDISSVTNLQARPFILLLLDTLFFALLAYSLWPSALRPELYVRPIGYVVSIALMSTTLAARILLLPSKNWQMPFTFSELQALDTISANYERAIYVDDYYLKTGYASELSTKLEGRLESVSPCRLAIDFNLCPCDIILIRDEVVSHPIGAGKGTIYRLNYDPRQFLTEQRFSKVYDCSSVNGFIR